YHLRHLGDPPISSRPKSVLAHVGGRLRCVFLFDEKSRTALRRRSHALLHLRRAVYIRDRSSNFRSGRTASFASRLDAILFSPPLQPAFVRLPISQSDNDRRRRPRIFPLCPSCACHYRYSSSP